jgi:hypothetical protein
MFDIPHLDHHKDDSTTNSDNDRLWQRTREESPEKLLQNHIKESLLSLHLRNEPDSRVEFSGRLTHWPVHQDSSGLLHADKNRDIFSMLGRPGFIQV